MHEMFLGRRNGSVFGAPLSELSPSLRVKKQEIYSPLQHGLRRNLQGFNEEKCSAGNQQASLFKIMESLEMGNQNGKT